MEKKGKTDNFLKAIKKHAKAQKNAMKSEVSLLKEEKIKRAENKAKRDSEKLIRDKLEEKRNEQTAILAQKTREGQRRIFFERARMTDEVFNLASKKLTEYAKTEEYRRKLIDSAKEIAKLFESNDCVLYISEKDMEQSDEIKAVFEGNTSIKADRRIKLGGIIGYCDAMGIVADETLDNKLLMQREWFIENADLSVL